VIVVIIPVILVGSAVSPAVLTMLVSVSCNVVSSSVDQ